MSLEEADQEIACWKVRLANYFHAGIASDGVANVELKGLETY